MTNYNISYLLNKEPQLNYLHHKNYEEICKEVYNDTDKWMVEKFKLISREQKKHFDKFNIELLVAWQFLRADSEQLKLISKYYVWATLADDFMEDLYDKPEELNYLAQQIVNVLKGEKLTLSSDKYDKWILSWQDVVHGFQKKRPNKWMESSDKKRFIEHFAGEWLEGLKKEMPFYVNKQKPTLEEYVKYRPQCLFCHSMIFSAEFVDNTSNKVFKDKRVNELITIIFDHAFRLNDLYSLWKDKRYGGYNYVLLTAQEKGLTEEEAKDFVCREIEDLAKKYNTIYQQIKGELNKEDICAYIESMASVENGSLMWYEKYTERYKTEKVDTLRNEQQQQQQQQAQILQTTLPKPWN